MPAQRGSFRQPRADGERELTLLREGERVRPGPGAVAMGDNPTWPGASLRDAGHNALGCVPLGVSPSWGCHPFPRPLFPGQSTRSVMPGVARESAK